MSPLKHHDVVLNILWLHCNSEHLNFPDRVLHKGKNHRIVAESKGETIPIVSNTSAEKQLSMLFLRTWCL